MTPSDDLSRNDLAEDRTILANERTFAGWMRTSIACVAIGVGFAGLFHRLHPGWVPRAIATAFLLTAVAVILLANRRASGVLQRLSPHVIATARPLNLTFLTTVICLCAAVLMGAIWMLDLN